MMAWLWRESSQGPTQMISGLLRSLVYNSMHIVAYAALSTSWLLALWQPGTLAEPRTARRLGWIGVVLAVAYGVVDEVHQSYVPGRVPSCGDVISDAVGAILALLWWRWLLLAEGAALRALSWGLFAAVLSVLSATFIDW